MTRFARRLNARLIKQTLRQFAAFEAQVQREGSAEAAAADDPSAARPATWRQQLGLDRRGKQNAAARWLVEFLRLEVVQRLDWLTALTARQVEFRSNYARVFDQDEARQMLMDYALELGANWWQRVGDRRALRRWLNDEALHDRYLRRRGEWELQLMFLLDRLGTLVDLIVGGAGRAGNVAALWERVGVEPLVLDAFEYVGDRRVRVAAMQCLATSLRHVATDAATHLLGESATTRVQRYATDAGVDVWLQCAAIDVLSKVDEELFARVVRQRLMRPAGGDDLFVRRHCLRRIADHPRRFAGSVPLWERVAQDPSPAVRQQLAAMLWQLPLQEGWPLLSRIIRQDPCGQVRAAALLGALDASADTVWRSGYLPLLAERIWRETDAFGQRVAMHVAVQWLTAWIERPSEARSAEAEQIFAQQVLPALDRVRMEAEDVQRRRWAAAAAERLWVLLDPAARALYAHLRPLILALPRGRSRYLRNRLVADADPDLVGRVLAVLTQDDFGLELTRAPWGIRCEKQPRFAFRCWRFWNELWRPATDKRQAYRHTTGRVPRGALRSPSRILGELSVTKVPGEPLVVAPDGTWRPFLPLPDDFVAALNRSWLLPGATQLYSSEGVTEIRVTRDPLRRLRAAWQLIRRLPALAELRNWDSASSQPPQRYLQAMQQLGFRVSFRPHAGRPADTSVTQFFPALLLFVMPSLPSALRELVESYAYYFSSAFENTLSQLVVFTAAALILFLGRHAWSNLNIWLARRRVPLSIGGWGTRGKSGTERLKAALLNAGGHPLVSKTTGCEAMFIHACACGEPLEIPLYRPGDKATIWEQSNLLRLAAGMQPSAFLWECMALTPDYVDVLQQQWMHDDLATITNTYPDHEDIQGPSGMDVATTITGFVPRRSHLLTTEQQMFPLVRERGEQRHTSVRGVTWLESGLITDDLLNRFAYREHPDNIALVAALADELGVPYDAAVKAMADHLIPDLGVLKTHPVAQVQACSLEFTNGMSANERFGCLGNWKRLGYDTQDPHKDPATFISTVVNNRADRVARSRVFAGVLVHDLRADRHFLIGGNLKGLQGFIWESWDEYERTVSLGRENSPWDAEYARRQLQQLAQRFRVPTSDPPIRSALAVMLSAVAPTLAANDAQRLADQLQLAPEATCDHLRGLGIADTLVDRVGCHLQSLLQSRQEFQNLLAAIDQVQGQPAVAALDARLRETLKQWFARKLVVIERYDATGEEIIQRIVDETPPGFLNRVMGVQNIKGTGLDFVYRFHAWDTCHQACELLETNDQQVRAPALHQLESLPQYGLLCQERLQQTLDQLRHATPPLLASQQVLLESIRRKLNESLEASRKLRQQPDQPEQTGTHPWVNWGVTLLEQWMEVQDAVRRRRQADQIYSDLRWERISRRRAVEELRQLNKRQKGGWLMSRLTGRHD